MIQWSDIPILAEEDDSLFSFVWLIVALGIPLIITIYNKIKERARREQADRQARQPSATRQVSSPQAPPPPPRSQPVDEQAQAQRVIAELFGAPQTKTQEPPPPPPEVKPKPRPKPKVRPQPLTSGLGRGVEDEVHRMEQAQQVEETQREERLSGVQRRGQRAAASGKSSTRKVRVQVDLSRRDEARKAFIYSEIFGRPKSLREEPELWDQ